MNQSEEKLKYVSVDKDTYGYRLVFQFDGGGASNLFIPGSTVGEVLGELELLLRLINRSTLERIPSPHPE